MSDTLRPEDRCRSHAQAGLYVDSAASLCRSEGFAEDLPPQVVLEAPVVPPLERRRRSAQAGWSRVRFWPGARPATA
ncbi:MAG: hypothetical protein M3Y32_02560 [Pseudomonadota bacterium]|nr:hypothetical protein [Pseudomonadota bacterium]